MIKVMLTFHGTAYSFYSSYCFRAILLTLNLLIVTESDATYLLDLHDKLISTIDQTLAFYDKQGLFMNIDGIVGIQALRGQLQYLLKVAPGHFPPSLILKLREWQAKTEDAGHVLIANVKEKEKSYFDSVGHLVEKPLVAFGDGIPNYKAIKYKYLWDSTFSYESHRLSPFSEERSDLCLKELRPYAAHENDAVVNLKKDCSTLSDGCLKMMLLANKTNDYNISHQSLYVHFVKQFGCESSVNDWLASMNMTHHSRSLSNIEMTLCTNMFVQLSDHWYSLGGQFDCDHRDVLMEFVFSCGNLGFYEFLNFTFLEQALSWQKRGVGCFEGKLSATSTEARCFNYDQHVSNSPAVNISATSRKLLVEVALKGGCSSHFSSVMLSALSVYLRMFYDPHLRHCVHEQELWLKEFMEHRVKSRWPQTMHSPAVDDDADDSDTNSEFIPSVVSGT